MSQEIADVMQGKLRELLLKRMDIHVTQEFLKTSKMRDEPERFDFIYSLLEEKYDYYTSKINKLSTWLINRRKELGNL